MHSSANAQKRKVLFLCTGNSCRSQMAEGWTRALHDASIEVYSAGLIAHGLNPKAVAVMAEAGVDISNHRSQTVADLGTTDFDYVVSVCSHAEAHCPSLPGVKHLHAGFDDPPQLAKNETDPERILDHYRRVRDEIRTFVVALPDRLV